jgi:hypothetical protein
MFSTAVRIWGIYVSLRELTQSHSVDKIIVNVKLATHETFHTESGFENS